MILVINLSFGATVYAETKVEKEAKFIEKVKADIAKLGTGKDSRIQVKLKDGTKLKGYIGQINENSFVVIDERSGAPTEVPYPKTKQVKGNNLSTGVTIALAVVIFLVIAAIVGATSSD